MPRLCTTCRGSKKIERTVDRTWWRVLLFRPSIMIGPCSACGGSGVIKGSPEEEAVLAMFDRIEGIQSLPYDQKKVKEQELVEQLSSLSGTAIDAMVTGLSRDYKVAGLTGDALKRIGNPAIAPLIRALSSAIDEDLQRRGAETLGDLKAKEAVGTLVSFLRSSNSSVRRAAIDALGKIADSAAAEPLIQLLNTLEDPDLVAATCGSLSKLSDSRAIDPVLKALSRLRFDRSREYHDEKIHDARQSVAKSLAAYPVRDLVPPLALACSDERTGAEAVGLLGKLLESKDVGQVPETDLRAVAQLGECSGLTLNTLNRCKGRWFGEITPVDATAVRQLARQELVRRGGEHDWMGCKCKDCGLIRDEQHDWNGCLCRTCGSTRHDWNGCECRSCGIDRHLWSGCLCRNCETQRHDWDKCKCRACKTTRHEWDRILEQAGWKHYQCKLCGKTGKMPQDAVWISGNDPFPD